MALARAARAAYFRKCTEAAANIQRIYRGRRGRQLYRRLLKASKALRAAQEENSVELVVRTRRLGEGVCVCGEGGEVVPHVDGRPRQGGLHASAMCV
jgi:primosomal protein N''